MIIKWLVGLIKGEKRKEKVKVEIEELKKAILGDPKFRDEILRELEYRTGRRDILKAGVLGLLGLSLGLSGSYAYGNVSSNTVREVVSDYTGVKIPKPCTCIVAQDGTGDYDVSPGEDASEVIQRAIDYVERKISPDAYDMVADAQIVLRGKFRTTKSLKITKSGVSLVGVPAIIESDASPIIEISNNRVDDCNPSHVMIKNITIKGLRGLETAIRLAYCSNWKILFCKISNVTHALELERTWGDNSLMLNCELRGNPPDNSGLFYVKKPLNDCTNSFTIMNTTVQISNNNAFAFYFEDLGIWNINFYDVYQQGSGSFIYATKIHDSYFENCVVLCNKYGYIFNHAGMIRIIGGVTRPIIVNSGWFITIDTKPVSRFKNDPLYNEPFLRIAGLWHKIRFTNPDIKVNAPIIEIGHDSRWSDGITVHDTVFANYTSAPYIIRIKYGRAHILRNLYFRNVNYGQEVTDLCYTIRADAQTFVENCKFFEINNYKPFYDLKHIIIKNIQGDVKSEDSGVITIPAGSKSITVRHKLVSTPRKVFITPYDNISNIWVSDITENTFKINCSHPPTKNVKISWFATI